VTSVLRSREVLDFNCVLFPVFGKTSGHQHFQTVLFQNADASTNYSVKFTGPGDPNLDFGSTQGFAAAMAVALG